MYFFYLSSFYFSVRNTQHKLINLSLEKDLYDYMLDVKGRCGVRGDREIPNFSK